MSLISDTDYLIHSLRVQYLKHIDDPYGARIISLDQNYHSNPYIDASGLADIERWPELGMPSSPTPSDDESAPAVRRRHSGFPGANLKYTTTILGPTRTGAMGLRVNGKRQSMPRNPGRLSLSRENAGGKSSNEETLITTEVIAATPTSPMKPRSPRSPIKDSVVQPQKQDAQDGSAPPVPAKGPVLMFIPKFRGAEEMAARRRQRMAARANGPGMVRAPMVAMPINPEFSSSSSSEPEAESEDEVAADEDEEEFDMVADADDAVEVDEFDPEFAASRAAVNSDSASETGSILSGASVVPPSTSARASRLSPVREGGERPSVSPEHDDGKLDAMFEMVTPAPSTAANIDTDPAPAPSATANTPAGMFERRPVPPARAGVSALTAMLASTSSSSSSNPFTELYSAISGRPETTLSVKKDATVEEVLGNALWTYWEESWLPQIDEGLSGEETPKEDGEVDEDWPHLELQLEAYAVVEATPSQSEIQRRISRVVVKKKSTGLLTQAAPSTNLVPPADLLGISSSAFGSMGSSVGLSSSLGPSSSSGPPLFLRHVSTTIQASGGMYMQEVLELVCQNQKRGFTDPKEYALVIETKEAKVNIPLDRTVRSLQGRRDLILMKKNLLHEYGVEMRERKATNDPNASIFTTDVSIQEQTLSSMLDLMQAYRKYTVYRKLPMMVTRSARVLTIDGGYIHVRIIPGATKAKHVFDSGKTSSYHLKSVVACQQSSKNAATFKLVVHSGAERNKRYEFEAENPKIANEIVSTIRALKAAMEKPGGGKASRRNTRIGPSSRPPGV
ncbi:uncharacterized protein BXZ73DRAFT_95139 [Epithele typhae]|uniref:uncharacterized protein n=1 Tax=Epithele typhae TaxID=378194 RepID=UPI002007B047|nr:uncharacterized protein BXZ73DRAFT_95139 [Epithele typhae]KAH9899127.1 hypothetical protein BXZ73DRAFT_95139 [Epithele typhae]